MRGGGAGDFGGVLDGARQHGRVAGFDDTGAAGFQRVEDGGDARLRVDHHGLAGHRLQCLGKTIARLAAHRVTQMRAHGRGDLLRRREQINRTILVRDHEGQRDRRARDILAADVEQPGDRIERGDHHGIGALAGQPRGHFGLLVGMGTAGELVIMHFQWRQARRRAVGPRRIDRVPCHRHQFGATRLELPSGLLGPGAGVQPGIIADALAGLRLFPQPLRGAGLRHVFIGK